MSETPFISTLLEHDFRIGDLQCRRCGRSLEVVTLANGAPCVPPDGDKVISFNLARRKRGVRTTSGSSR